MRSSSLGDDNNSPRMLHNALLSPNGNSRPRPEAIATLREGGEEGEAEPEAEEA